MQRSNFSGEDPVANATRDAERVARQHAAIAEDSARTRAGIAASRGTRSIGTIRTPARP
jgi:hypothetical protein